jgi:hypothetical protein
LNEDKHPFQQGGIMRALLRLVVTLSVGIIACQGRGSPSDRDTLVQRPTDSPAAAPSSGAPKSGGEPRADGEPKPADSGPALASGKEPGTIPATRTPAVTSENSIATMRLHLQRLDTASVQTLQGKMTEHSKMLGDLLTTMRVEVQAATSSGKNAWIAAADSLEGDLDRLALAQGEELRTAFRAHRTRVVRLLDEFRVLVPAKSH